MLRIWPDVSDTVQLIIFYIHLVNFVAVSTLKGKLQTLTNEKKYIETENNLCCRIIVTIRF